MSSNLRTRPSSAALFRLSLIQAIGVFGRQSFEEHDALLPFSEWPWPVSASPRQLVAISQDRRIRRLSFVRAWWDFTGAGREDGDLPVGLRGCRGDGSKAGGLGIAGGLFRQRFNDADLRVVDARDVTEAASPGDCQPLTLARDLDDGDQVATEVCTPPLAEQPRNPEG